MRIVSVIAVDVIDTTARVYRSLPSEPVEYDRELTPLEAATHLQREANRSTSLPENVNVEYDRPDIVCLSWASRGRDGAVDVFADVFIGQ